MRNLLCILALIAACSAQAKSYLCPSTFAYVTHGMKVAAVEEACGKPKAINKTTATAYKEEHIHLIVYRFVPSWRGDVPGKPQVTFEVTKNKVTAIRLEGSSIHATSLCGDRIANGDEAGKVIILCGHPALVDEFKRRIPVGRKEVEVWSYEPIDFQPEVTLEFENGVLTKVND